MAKASLKKPSTSQKNGKTTSRKHAPVKARTPRRPVARPAVKAKGIEKPSVRKTKLGAARAVPKVAPRPIPAARPAVAPPPAPPAAPLMKARRPVEPAPTPMRIPEAVPTDGKPRKNLAGFSSKDLEHFRDMLFAKRRELVGDMSAMEREALRTSGGTNLSTLPIHMADMGTDNYEQEFTLGLVEKDRNLLKEINSALAKIMNGTYGLCEGTGKPIGRPRLEAAPWARFSIEWARQLERRGRM